MNLEVISESTSPQARGMRLKTLRHMAGFTTHRFAKKYGIGSSTIKYWERGRVEGLTAKGANKIIAAIRQEGIYSTTAWLMYGIGRNPYILDMRQGTQQLIPPICMTLEL